MKRFSLIYAYYDNPKMLNQHLEEWARWSPEVRELCTFIIVDDASPIRAIDVVLEFGSSKLPLQVYRVEVNKPWGQDGARNIGMKETLDEWNLMTDMDHVLTRAGADRLAVMLESKAQAGFYYLPRRIRTSGAEYHAHPNSFVMAKSDFWKMGGYDEDFVGFYGSDGNFRKCCKGSGLVETYIDDFALVLHGVNDCHDANTRVFGRKESELWAAKNPFLNRKRQGPAYRAVNPHRLPYARVL